MCVDPILWASHSIISMATKAASPVLVLLSLFLVQVLFGINYVVSKVIVTFLPPLVWAGGRLIIATMLMGSIALLMRRPRPKGVGFYVPVILFGILGVVINQGAFLIGLSYTTPTNSAILNTTVPIFTLMIVIIRGQELFSAKKALGFVFALVGVLAIRRIEDFTLSNDTFIGDLLILVNSCSLAIFLALSKKFSERYDRIWTTVWYFIVGSVGFSILSAPELASFQPPKFDLTLILCMAYGIIGATIMTYFLNVWTLSQAKSSHVALFIYFQPVVATSIAWLWLDQVPTARTFVSLLLIFAGMILGIQKDGAEKLAIADTSTLDGPTFDMTSQEDDEDKKSA